MGYANDPNLTAFTATATPRRPGPGFLARVALWLASFAARQLARPFWWYSRRPERRPLRQSEVVRRQHAAAMVAVNLNCLAMYWHIDRRSHQYAKESK